MTTPHDRFEPGDGWREVESDQSDNDVQVVTWWDGERWHYWVREAPVPPLPTEPGTVIAIGDWRLVLLEPYEPGLPGAWEMLPVPKARQESIERAGAHMQCAYGGDWVRAEVEQHGGFEVLSEPRAATAKAVLDRVRSYVINATDEFHHDWLDEIARDFEVSS